jgi:hypothetical protein
MGQRPKLKATFARKWLTDGFCAVRGAASLWPKSGLTTAFLA